jgi:Tfx family DNA-binding protein
MPAQIRDDKIGLFTKSQFLVLKFRSDGLTQRQTAKALGTSRANVSMIELRAKRNLGLAKGTIRAFESIQSYHSIEIKKGIRLQQIPEIILHEGDRYGIHLKSNIVEIIRMVKSFKSSCINEGKISKKLVFIFNQSGKLSLISKDKGRNPRRKNQTVQFSIQ